MAHRAGGGMDVDFSASSQRITRRAALRCVAAGAGLTVRAACSAPSTSQPAAQPTAAAVKPAVAPTPAAQQAAPAPTAAQQAPAAATGQKVALRWFFWTATEEERQFWETLAVDAMQKVPTLDDKF